MYSIQGTCAKALVDIKMNEFKIYYYPIKGFKINKTMQSKLSSKMKQKVLFMKITFLFFMLVFIVIILLLYLRIIAINIILPAILSFACLPFLALFYLPPPFFTCTKCGNKMQKELKTPKNKSGLHEFLVCHNCKIFICTFRTPGRV